VTSLKKTSSTVTMATSCDSVSHSITPRALHKLHANSEFCGSFNAIVSSKESAHLLNRRLSCITAFRRARHWALTSVPSAVHILKSNLIIVYYSPTDAQMIVLKTILKFTLKQLRHVSVQSHHLQAAHYSCLLKLQFVKIVNYGTSVCD